MLFWMFVILTVVLIVLAAIGTIHDIFSLDLWGGTLAFFSLIVTVIMLVCVILGNVNTDAQIAKYNARYDMLVRQYENDIYENDNDLGKRELIEDIQAWNEDLAYNQEVQDSFWTGIFYANIYDQFEFIELK